MPLLPTTPIDIEIEISDVTIGQTVFKRKAKLFTMIYNMKAKSLALTWYITFYAKNADGSYGEDLSYLIPPVIEDNVADNTTAVDPITGAIIPWEDLQPTVTIDPITGEETTTETTKPYIGQYDWFNAIGETQSINVHGMIRQFADVM